MPKNPFQSNVVEIRQEDLKENEFSQAGVQASETFRIDAQEGQVVGSRGELTGFVKKEFGSERKSYEAVLNVEKDRVTLKQVKDLKEKVDFLDPTNMIRTEAEWEINDCKKSLEGLGERNESNSVEFDKLTQLSASLQQKFEENEAQAAEAKTKLANLCEGIDEEGNKVEGLGEKASAILLINEIRTLTAQMDFRSPQNGTRLGIQQSLDRAQSYLDDLGSRTEENAKAYDEYAQNRDRIQRDVDRLNPIAEAAEAKLSNLLKGINIDGQEVEGLSEQAQVVAKALSQQKAAMAVAGTSGMLYDGLEFQTNVKLGGDRQLLTRAVASTAVDRLFGTNVIAEEKFGVDEKGNVVGVSVQAEGCGVKGDYRSPDDGIKRECVLLTDYSKPAIQQGLAALEAVDYITGQVDRHCGNIFVDPDSGKVTGIDNDLAFPKVDRESLTLGATFKGTEGLPRILDQATADKIMAVTPDQLRATLQGVQKPGAGETLGPREIEGAVQRLQQLQAAIRNPAAVQRPEWEHSADNLTAEERAKLQNHPPFQVVPKFTPEHHAAALEYQDLRFKAATGVKMSEAESASQLAEFNRTSYAGSIEGQTKLIGKNMAEGRGNSFGTRPDNTITPIARNPALAANQNIASDQFTKLAEQMHESVIRNPGQLNNNELTTKITSLQAEMARLDAKMAEYKERQSKPTLGDRFRGLLGGGTKRVLEGKAEVAKTALEAKKQELDQAVEEALQPHLKEMEEVSRQVSRSRQPVERVGAALRHSQEHEHHHHNANSVGGSGEIDLSHEKKDVRGPKQSQSHPHH